MQHPVPKSETSRSLFLHYPTAMASPINEEPPKHEIDYYLSVKERMESLVQGGGGIPVKMKTPLSTALNKLSNSPAISFAATYCYAYLGLVADISLTVGGEDAGTFGHPNIEKILEKSEPSPFGKGDKTVMDLEYRNGREIVAKNIGIGSGARYSTKEAFYKLIENHISESLFGGKNVNIELYKLAVYGKGGHFDWHRDTTHGDDHHATVLVALNTEWEGGNLGLRHEGKTVDADMHALMMDEEESDVDEDEESKLDDEGETSKKPGEKRSILAFQVIAFYTDTEHKIENITDGTRIVLQFDVKVGGRRRKDPWDEDFNLGGSDEYDTTKPLFPLSGTDPKTHSILEELVVMIKELHTSKSINEVVLPLRHLYRLASIKPDYLKGVDAYLYERLKRTFEISLKPIMIVHETDFDGSWSEGEVAGFPFVSALEGGGGRPLKKKRKVEQKSEIHVPRRYELMKISHEEYIEYTGNEAQLGESRYFGGGMFVATKVILGEGISTVGNLA